MSQNNTEKLSIDHVRLFVGNTVYSTSFYGSQFNFEKVSEQGMQSSHRTTSIIQQNNIKFALTSSNHPVDTEFFEYYRKHGDQSVQDIAFYVKDVSLLVLSPLIRI